MLRDLSNLVRRPRVPMRGVLRQGGTRCLPPPDLRSPGSLARSLRAGHAYLDG